MVAIVPIWSKPSIRRPSGSISVKPKGPLSSFIPFDRAHFSTASKRALLTSLLSMKSTKPNLAVFFPVFSLT